MQSLKTLRSEAATCHACPLWKRGTRTVFGEGRARARLMLVGEQPGDQEDIQGHQAEIAAVKPDVVLATVHPSSILREPDRDARHAAEAAFVRDLAKVGTWKSE